MNYTSLQPLRKYANLNALFWKCRPALVRNPAVCGLWQWIFERGRLRLPSLPEQWLHCFALEQVNLPGTKDLSHGQDAPLNDLLFLLQLIKMAKPRRILEIGTYRAKSTYAFAMNAPDAEIVSYDICRIESPYRDYLDKQPRCSLRVADFSKEKAVLADKPFDFIFIDAGHRLKEVLDDSHVCFQLAAESAYIIWHDYRTNEFLNPGLEVPEALSILQKERAIFGVPGTTCAVWCGIPNFPKFL